ncbi:hypothetical protein [Pseudarthrobacter sp. YAF2]|uniref:hypothetical protein n=1 Tax=Pseudarthrobacter sp. YAF2 TaxID=3233078 RepID=UPI003F998650
MSAETSPIVVKVEDAASLHVELEHASSILREKATSDGLLVTRVDFTTYTVALSSDIPFGFTRELDLL